MEELCLLEFLFADMNTAGDAVLPPNHSVVLWKNPDAEVHWKSSVFPRQNNTKKNVNVRAYMDRFECSSSLYGSTYTSDQSFVALQMEKERQPGEPICACPADLCKF